MTPDKGLQTCFDLCLEFVIYNDIIFNSTKYKFMALDTFIYDEHVNTLADGNVTCHR